MATPARDPDNLTPELIHQATDDLLALVGKRLPERFYPGDVTWRWVLTALIARMMGTLESLRPLADPQRQTDALVLLRSLYENVVTFMWLAIDPEPRVQEWHAAALYQRSVLHREARPYGAGEVLSEEELQQADKAKLKPLQQLAAEVDDHWGPKIKGLYSHPADGGKHILTLEGLYVGVFRIASGRAAHATLEAIDAWVEPTTNDRIVVNLSPRPEPLQWSGLAIPLFTIALTVAHERLGWPDEEAAREINAALMHEPPSG